MSTKLWQFYYMFTKIISGPICLISLKAITISSFPENSPQKQKDGLTIILQIQPVQESNSKSLTWPNFLQSQTLITSFWHKSLKRINITSPVGFLLVYACFVSLCISVCFSARSSISNSISSSVYISILACKV